MGGSQARLAAHAGKGLRPARDCCDTQPGSAVPTRVAATQQRGTDHRSRPGVPTLPSPCLHRWLIRSLNLTSPWNPGTPFARFGSLVTTGACPRSLSGKCSCRNLGIAGVGEDSGGTAEEKGKMLIILRGYQTRD